MVWRDKIRIRCSIVKMNLFFWSINIAPREFCKDHTNQVRIISIITRFNNKTDFFCFMQLGFVTGWPTLSFSQKKKLSLLKGRMISKEINQRLYKVGPEFSFETLMTFKEGWNFSQFSLSKTEFSPLFLFCTFDLLRSLSFFYCGYLESTSTLVLFLAMVYT